LRARGVSAFAFVFSRGRPSPSHAFVIGLFVAFGVEGGATHHAACRKKRARARNHVAGRTHPKSGYGKLRRANANQKHQQEGRKQVGVDCASARGAGTAQGRRRKLTPTPLTRTEVCSVHPRRGTGRQQTAGQPRGIPQTMISVFCKQWTPSAVAQKSNDLRDVRHYSSEVRTASCAFKDGPRPAVLPQPRQHTKKPRAQRPRWLFASPPVFLCGRQGLGFPEKRILGNAYKAIGP